MRNQRQLMSKGFVDNDGSFVLRNTAGNEGANITLGSDAAETSNFLGRTNSLVTGRVYYEGDAIEFGFKDYWAGNGTAQDLSRLGLATTLSSDATIAKTFWFTQRAMREPQSFSTE